MQAQGPGLRGDLSIQRSHYFRRPPMQMSSLPGGAAVEPFREWMGRAARAFAAELLVPAAALARRVSGRLSEQDVENLAAEFSVSPQVIIHQVENHGLGYAGS